MKTKDGRVAKRRERRRARREERLRQQALLSSLGSTDWWDDGLEDSPTEQIVETLAKLGIQTDEARFRELAHAHGDVDGIAGAWLAQVTVGGIWDDYPWLAARALWPRWAPDLFSVDVFIHQHLDADVFDEDDPETPEDAQRQWRVAQAMINLVAPRAAEARPDLLEELTEHSAIDIGFWLGCVPFNLARFGMVDEAVEICTRMAPVYEPENFLTDGAEILAQAGQREEALRQVEENLARFPDDVWVRIKSGDVYEKVGNLAMAEATYRQALAMTDEDSPLHEREAAVERLGRLLQTTGRGEEAEALIEAKEGRDAELEKVFAAEYDEALAADDEELSHEAASPTPPVRSPWAVQREGPKVGRNEPCPCGSGQKFKRCCGR